MPDALTPKKTVAILGAGPVGLAAAAHVLERGLQPIVLEAGEQAAHAVRQWGHVRMFSPWEYNIDKAAGRLLAATGWNAPVASEYPTGGELVERYLEPLATRTALKDHIRTSSRVTAVGRAGFDKMKSNGRAFEPFTIRYRNGKGPEQLEADAVIDATGTWFSPRSRRGRRPAGVRRRRGPSADRLRHAGRAGAGAVALCRKDGGGAGRRSFRDRHADRSGAAEGRGAGNGDRLAAARRQAGEGLRRWRQRQARGARRAWRGLRGSRRRRKDPR